MKRGHQSDHPAREVTFAGGAALVQGDRAAVFADNPAGLGAAIDIANTNGAAELLFFSEANDGALARRASAFRLPTTVVDPDGDLRAIAPEPPAAVAPMPAVLEPTVRRFEAAGLDPVWEHGVLLGEWKGLEVARATVDRVDLGVGKHDREANRLFYPDGPTDAALEKAVAMVVAHRPELGAERWLRWVIQRRPELVGALAVQPVEPPAPRADLRARSIAPGITDDGTVVVCSVGVDPDLVPQAADARLHAGGERDLILVVPEGDDHPLTQRLAALLTAPARVVTVPANWRHS